MELSPNRKALRIWYIAESYPPEYGGGGVIFLRDVCRTMAERGHEVRVFCVECADSEPYSIRTDYDGRIRVDRINLPYFVKEDPEGWRLGFFEWRKHERRVASVLNELLGQWTPDIINYNTTRPFGEEGLISLGRRGMPTVALLHEAWMICGRLFLLRSPDSEPCSGPGLTRCLRCMYSNYDGPVRSTVKLPWRILKLRIKPAYRLWRRRKARRALSGAIAYSQFNTQRHEGHVPGIVRHVPLGINLDNRPARTASRPRSPLRFGFIAGFQPTKGVNHLLDAAKNLKDEGLRFEVRIWGPGQERGHQEIESRGLRDYVFLEGMYSIDEIFKVYSQIDVAVMATLVCEPFGRVIQEAAAVGRPSIAPSVGGITEQIRSGVDGLLYTFRDAKELEAQMRRVLTEPDLLPRLIANLPEVVDTRVRAIAVEDFYFDVLNKRNASAEDVSYRSLNAVTTYSSSLE